MSSKEAAIAETAISGYGIVLAVSEGEATEYCGRLSSVQIGNVAFVRILYGDDGEAGALIPASRIESIHTMTRDELLSLQTDEG